MKHRIELALLVVGLAILAGACSDDVVIVETEPPPLILREVVPDSVNVGEAPFDVSIRFNRVVRLDEINLVPVPPPASTGELRRVGSGIFVTWFDFVSEAGYGSQRLLLDGRYMELPVIKEWWTNASPPLGVFSGSVASEDTSRVQPVGAVVFALEKGAPFNPLDPGSFVGIDPRGIGCAKTLIFDRGIYSVGRLREFEEVIVVAILDTNDDAVYDPVSDWWGFHGEGLADEPVVVEAGVLPQDINDGVDIVLRPPR